MILDQFGKPIDTGHLRESQTARVAHLNREYENHPARGLTPARLANIMKQAEEGDLLNQLDLADDMEERDGQIYSELSKRKGALLPLEWTVVPPKGASAAEKKWAEQATEWMGELPEFEDVLLGMMDGVLKGFSNTEMVWSLQDGVLLPELTFRPQRWFTLGEDRQSITLRDNASQYGEPLRPFNWLSHIHRSRNGYLARGALARVLFWPYIFKNFSVRDLGEFLEIYGLPLRLGMYPSGASDAEKRTLLRAVTEIGHNAAGIIPQGMKIDFQNAAEGSNAPFMSMIEYMDSVESKVIVGQTLTSGEGKHGTQALGNVHNEVRLDIRNADARQIASTITQQLLRPLCLLNIAGADPRRLPRLVFDTGEPEDLKAYADSLPGLANMGMKIGLQWVHDKLRIPMATEDEELIHGPSAAPAPADLEDEQDPKSKTPPKPVGKQVALAALVGRGPRDALDDVVDEAAADWMPVMEPMVGPLLAEVQKALAAGESIEAFAARIPELLGQMDSQALAERLARVAFVGRLAGEADLDLGS